MTTQTTTDLDFYRTPGPLTELTHHASHLDALPRDIASLAQVVQGLLIHRFWLQAYKTEITPDRDRQQGLRSAAAMLDAAFVIDPRPLTRARQPDQRVVGICRHFATLLTAFLRYQDVPARARCGFATYFQPGKHVDHWVCEYWNSDQQRWVMVDAQLDALQVAAIKPDFDPLDVPRERFWVAGQALQRIRAGEADGDTFGIAGMWGDWFVKGDLQLDALSLNKIELLPWDVRDLTHDVDAPLTVRDADAFWDRIAALTTGDDASIAELRALCASDPRLQVPDAFMARIAEEDAVGGVAFNPVAP
jgi:transglutaminase superfamily protein